MTTPADTILLQAKAALSNHPEMADVAVQGPLPEQVKGKEGIYAWVYTDMWSSHQEDGDRFRGWGEYAYGFLKDSPAHRAYQEWENQHAQAPAIDQELEDAKRNSYPPNQHSAIIHVQWGPLPTEVQHHAGITTWCPFEMSWEDTANFYGDSPNLIYGLVEDSPAHVASIEWAREHCAPESMEAPQEPEQPEPAPLKVGVGKYYRRRDGDIVGPMVEQENVIYPEHRFRGLIATGGFGSYTENGQWSQPLGAVHNFDLVEEVPNPNATPAPEPRTEPAPTLEQPQPDPWLLRAVEAAKAHVPSIVCVQWGPLPERVQNKRGICLWDEDEWDAGCRRGEFPWEGTNPAFFYGLLLGSPAHLAMMGETSTTVPPETFTGTLHYTAPEGGGILPRYTHKLGGCWFPEDPTISLLKQVSKLKQKCKAAGQKVATVLYLNQHLRDENTQLQVAHTALDQELARVKLGNPGPCENPYAMWEKAIAEKTNRQVCLGRICIYLGVDSSRTQLDVLPELVREEIAQKNKAKDDNKVLAAQLRECQDKVVELQRKMEEKIQHPEVPYWFDSICGHLGVESSSTSGLKLVGLVRDLVARANAVQTPTRQDVLGCLGLICVHLGTDPTNTKLEDIADLVRELVERENRVAGEKNILSTKAQELQRKVEEKDQQIASLGEHAGTVRHENIKLIGQLDSVRNLLTAPTPESKDQVV